MADYTVTGAIIPDATGDYVQDGVYNGKPCYSRDGGGGYWIWWYLGDATWAISSGLGHTDPLWTNSQSLIDDSPYQPITNASGNATVTITDEESSSSSVSSSSSSSSSSSRSSPSASSSSWASSRPARSSSPLSKPRRRKPKMRGRGILQQLHPLRVSRLRFECSFP